MKRKNLIISCVILLTATLGTSFIMINKKTNLLDITMNQEKSETEKSDITVFKGENGKYGVIDDLGNEIIEPIYDKIIMGDLNKTFMYVEKDGEFAVLNRENVNLTGFKNKEFTVLNDKYNYRYSDYGNGIETLDGKLIIPTDLYKNIVPLYNNLFAAKNMYGRCGVIDDNNNIIIPFEYDEINANFKYQTKNSADVLRLIRGDNVYIANSKGKIIIDKVFPISDSPVIYDKIAYEDNGNIIIIDSTGKKINTFKNARIKSASYGKGLIFENTQNKLQGIIGKNSEILVEAQYDDITEKGDKFVVSSGKKKGLLNADGELIIPIQYDVITNYYPPKEFVDYILAAKDGTKTIFDNKGNKVMENITTKDTFIINSLLFIGDDKQINVLNLRNNCEKIIDYIPFDINNIENSINNVEFNKNIIKIRKDNKDYYLNSTSGNIIKIVNQISD